MFVDPGRCQVESHTAPTWYAQQPFHETMAEQLRRAPWLLLSVAIHAIAILILAMIPAMPREIAAESVAVLPQEPLAPFEPDVAPVEKPQELLPVEQPILQDTEVVQDTELSEEPVADFTDARAAAFDKDSWSIALGLGGGGKLGDRIGGRRALGATGGRDTAISIEEGLEWLKRHQDEDGKWDADDFMKHDVDGEPCDGPGNPVHDVGLTGLALLAFLGDGSTMRTGPYREVIKNAVKWLREQQDETGLFGSNASHDFIYDHAIAALAMTEAYGLSDYQLLRKYAQKGINYLESHRNPYMVWRYQPRDNDNDTSVTGWAVMAYKSAQDFKLTVNEQAMKLSLTWFDQVTDPTTGRAGYTQRGEPSSRHPGDHSARFPPEKGEALTAVGLMCRFFLGQDPEQTPVMVQAANTILQKPPVWNADDGSIDHYYWYYGTYALYQMGKRHWTEWSKYLTTAVVNQQREDGNYRGSWDPIGAWGEDGGRVYSTAILVLTLEAYYRYTRVFVR